MAKLTPERLFADPPLFAEPPRDLRMAPNGTCLSFLLGAAENSERLDLWRADPATGEGGCWVHSADLPAAGAPSAAERAAMERRRSFSTGITGHQWLADGSAVLLIAEGAGHLLDAATGEVRQLTPRGRRCTDLKLSPQGRRLSYVSESGLHVRSLDGGAAQTVAASEDPNQSFGSADFLAQEELHRFDGHWWREDGRQIAFTRVDLSPVKPSQRFEADADGLRLVEQRYPFAGEANPQTALALHDLQTGASRWIDCAEAPDDYLARVAFVRAGLAVQMLNRAQDRLLLKIVRLDDLSQRILIEEDAAAWINLHDNFTEIGQNDYLWTSERDGASHLYRYQGGGCEQLTSGPGRVNRVLCADAQQAFLSGWFETPTEQHLHRLDLASRRLERLTDAGWHELSATEQGGWIIDQHSSLTWPKETRFGPPEGPWLPLRCPPSGEDSERLRQAPSRPKDAQGNADGQAENAKAGASRLRLRRGHPYREFADAHVQPQLGTIAAEDGQALHYRLTRPERLAAPAPLVVYVYGGPGVQLVRNDWPPLLLQLFAQRGFGVLELDNRGSANRERAFETAIHRRLGAAEVRDQAKGAEFAAALPWVDGDRIGAFGHSYGGYMALMCLALTPNLFKAAAAAAPVTDWRLYDSCYTERYLGQPADHPQAYAASSPLSQLDGIQGALLLMHGMSDDNVVFTHSMRLMQALQERNKPFELMAYPNAKHSMQQRAVAVHRFNLILDFFSRRLAP